MGLVSRLAAYLVMHFIEITAKVTDGIPGMRLEI